jgi:hypothetical protein
LSLYGSADTSDVFLTPRARLVAIEQEYRRLHKPELAARVRDALRRLDAVLRGLARGTSCRADHCDEEEPMTMAQKPLIGEKPTDVLWQRPAEGWTLRVFGAPIAAEGKLYGHGSTVPESVLLGRNAAVLLRQGRLRWCPPSADAGPVPRDLPAPPPPPAPTPPVVIVEDDRDLVVAWKRSLEATVQAQGDNNFARAKDRLIRDERGSNLYLRASKVNYDAQMRGRRPGSPFRAL